MRRASPLLLLLILPPARVSGQNLSSWRGVLRDAASKPLEGALVELQAVRRGGVPQAALPEALRSLTDREGTFNFAELAVGTYRVSVSWQGRTVSLEQELRVLERQRLEAGLELSSDWQRVALRAAAQAPASRASGGELLSGTEVSSLPLNKRDFSQLLLLAVGTMTDANGAANFTQQFAVNGQRGANAVFAIDGIYATDPELGGATFANLNVDAIEQIQSSSGVMPAEIGQGAAGFTNVVTKSGGPSVHGAVFEFVRNAALDARNFFDRRTIVNPGRIPPFTRNEFGVTNGGPVVLPGIYHGRNRTFYFGQYQGFRQVLGTTQVLSVPTVAERQGLNTTAFAGDTLFIPVSPLIRPVLDRYPLPNDPQGAYGARTYATSAKIATSSNQFSLRLDHNISEKARLFARFNFNDVTGPTTNPNQVAIDRSFAIRFFDHQRNFGLTYTRVVSPRVTFEFSLGALRTTPFFPTVNPVQPALVFGDGLYEPFNSAAGQFIGAYGNLFQVRQNVSYSRGAHTFKMGFESRFNLDTTIFGFRPNGVYTFGGGTAYSPVEIPSASGQRDIHVGDPLPDALSGFLTATPFQFSAEVGAPPFAQDDHTGQSAVRREAYNLYFQDSWKVSPRFSVNYGLRYEVNTRIREADHRTSNVLFVGPDGAPALPWEPGVRQKLLFHPQPPYLPDWAGWGPRLGIEWRAGDSTTLRAGGAIATILPNLFQQNFLTGSVPFVFSPHLVAAPGAPVPFQNSVFNINFPTILTPAGTPVIATGHTTDVPANTEMDLVRFEQDLAAVFPGNQVQALSLYGTARDFQNGYIGSYTAGVDHAFGDLQVSASYVATVGVKLASLTFPNGYAGADPAFAPFTLFDAAGNVQGGIGLEYLIGNRSHSTYHSLQTSVQKTSTRWGLGFQVGYTLAKSLDDTSNIFGSLSSSSGALLQAFPQNPGDPGADKGPSTFDLRHVLVFTGIQALRLERIGFLRPLGHRLLSGWQLLSISTLTSGPPFTVYSGVQQTGVGSYNADRPDQAARPVLSTGRVVREDYFGQGENNAAFFSIPIGVPGGSGPNQGRFGALGRNTFRGPAFREFSIALIKETPLGHRAGGEAFALQLRAEFFNVFNLVNFGLPTNIVRGSGFGLISRTLGSSRQVQLSLKLTY